MQTRFILIAVLIICAAVFVFQNLGTVPFNILFVKIEMPALIFYSVLLAIGFGLGITIKKSKK